MSVHNRTLTSMLSPIPSESSPSGSGVERAHSVPGEHPSNLQPTIISHALEETHGTQMTHLVHTQPDPTPATNGSPPLNHAELKTFDPLAVLSPPQAHKTIQPDTPERKQITTVTLLDATPNSTTPVQPIPVTLGPNQTISSINSYSSSALSSGSFTAISVSPIPTDLYHPSSITPADNGDTVGRSMSVDAINTGAASLPTVAQLSITPPSTTGPEMHHTPLDSTSSRQSITSTTSRMRGLGDTPSIVRVHEDDSTSPYVDNASNVALSGLLSPSFPSNDQGDSPHLDSPLPPVVSALMAAQKVAGTAPGVTLAMPAQSQSGRLIFLSGDASGAGKSCIAMGLLHLFLKRGYEPKELAYIKPCTQCEDVQIVSKYCEQKGIAHQGLGPVIFYEGFTAEVIDGKVESVDKRRARISKAVNKIAEDKKWVIVDGVGYAAVGSVAGVSNAEVASLLNAPVLVVGRPGIGNAIDSMNFIMAYFEKFHVHTLGACWNKIPPMHSYHSYDKCKQYVNKYFREVRGGIISTYGHIPLVQMKPADPAAPASGSAEAAVPGAVSCRLRPAKTDLEMTPVEEEFTKEFLQVMEKEFDIEQLLGDLQKYYQAHRVQLVSVV